MKFKTNMYFFEFYANLGYKIIPLLHKGKQPIFSNWYNYDLEQVSTFIRHNNQPLNFGLLLGDIIDIEGDCVESNNFLNENLKDIYHPVFQSSKSQHHLFLNPGLDFTRIVRDGIEYRAKKHQSVLPPSKHSDGTEYYWLTEIFHVRDIPVLPKEFQTKILSFLSKIKKNKPLIKKGHTVTRCCCCNKEIFLHKKRLDLELAVMAKINLPWSCNKCRTFDIRQEVRKIRQS